MKDGKKEYQKLQKKYKLPSLKELTDEFGFHIHESDSVLHDIIGGVLEVISDNCKTLESIIFVDSGSPPSNLYEAKMLSEEKIDAFGLFKELMSIHWNGRRVKTKALEKEMAEFIKQSYKEWKNKLKPRLVKVFEIFEKEWKNAKLREVQTSISYLG